MNRLQRPPAHLVPRVLLLCLAYALLLLWTGGATVKDAWAMVAGTLQISPEGASALHVLLPRSVRTFFLVLLALVTGLSFALAATLLASLLGKRLMRMTGWLGRALAGAPPMGWAMGGLVLLLRGWHLPVETLFPHQTPTELDSSAMHAAREIWAWVPPVVALSLPVFGSAFFSLTHRLSALLDSPANLPLKARGLMKSAIVHRHFTPLLGVHMARLARPAVGVLLCFAIPVEEMFGFDGWGHFVSVRLSAATPQPLALATAMWSAAWTLAALLLLAGWSDRRGLPPSQEEVNDHGQRRSWISVGFGLALLAVLVFPCSPGNDVTVWSQLTASHDLWLGEVPRALLAALGALVLVILGVPLLLPSLRSRWLADGGLIASLGLAPLFLMLLLWDPWHARSSLAVSLALAIPGLGSLRAFFLDDTRSGILEASRALGESTLGVCRRHLLRLALPGLLNWTLRTAGTALILFSVLDFYNIALRDHAASSWGASMRVHHDDLLEHPAFALGPALWIALWSLSFRLLSRAFRTETPESRTSTFAP